MTEIGDAHLEGSILDGPMWWVVVSGATFFGIMMSCCMYFFFDCLVKNGKLRIMYLDEVEIATCPDWHLLLELVAHAAKVGIVTELERAGAILLSGLKLFLFHDFNL